MVYYVGLLASSWHEINALPSIVYAECPLVIPVFARPLGWAPAGPANSERSSDLTT